MTAFHDREEVQVADEVRDVARFLEAHAGDYTERLERFLAEFELERRRSEGLGQRLLELQSQNDKLVGTLSEARKQMDLLKEEVEKLCAPPNTYGVFECANEDGTLDIGVDGRRMRVGAHPGLRHEDLLPGQLLVLNEAFNAVRAAGFAERGELMRVADVLDESRLIALGHGDAERVISLSAPLRGQTFRAGDSVLVDPRSGFGVERLPKSEAGQVALEEIPDVGYEDIGGLGSQIEVLRDAIELPYLHADAFRAYDLTPPKGILLYGPPGCGKTMIGKAVASELARHVAERRGGDARAYFLNVKGPELLDKYVGESEHKLRSVFKRAREKAEEGVPVVVFFDEMDSLLRLRGSGVSSDIEATVVAQFLSEIDGVESLRNVIVIGATNRPDLIDPAVLRPGRLDLKVKVQRPDANAAREILRKYLVPELPLAEAARRQFGPEAEATAAGLIDRLVESMYAESEENRFLEVTYQKGEREILYFRDFASGAMLRNVVDRAKKRAVKRSIQGAESGIGIEDLICGMREEFRENEDLPSTTNPDDWARISGRRGERIAGVRTLIASAPPEARAIEEVGGSGQYL